MQSTNRKWQHHLRSKGIMGFFLDRLQSHALTSAWQYGNGPFDFPIDDAELDDELSRAYFEFTEQFPYELYIELTNHCNLECVMCARPKMTRPLGIMSEELFKKIIDEIAEKQPFAYIHYYGIGESLLDKKVFDKLAYAREKGLNNSVLFTNGQILLEKDNYKRLADAGLSTIGVDLDGVRAQTYEKIRVGGSFEKAKQGIVRLHEYLDTKPDISTRVDISFHIYKDVNEMDVEPFIEWCEAGGYEYTVVTMHTWAGLRDDIPESGVDGVPAMHRNARRNPCPYLWSGMSVAWDGRVGLCFQDADLNETMGDINAQSIESVWTSSFREKRRQHVQGAFNGLCESCSSNTEVRTPPFGSSLYPKKLRG
jgi:hypothetical protein